MFQPKTILTTLSAAALLITSAQSWALATDRDQPVYIEADYADIDQLNHVTVYRGNVKIRQGSIGIWGDVVTIYTDQNNDLIKAFSDAKAGSLARFKQMPDDKPDEVWGEGERLEYWAIDNLVKIFRRGKLWQGEDVFTSHRILYDTAKEVLVGGDRTTAGTGQAKERVRMTIQPKKQ
ncbi:MAG: lipopolysaccharide transport periplasmic protein LptA [Gammaproteobacteria bacterium]|nr:lipopolysaccharide transport periplasmic protein LptA [Gammaproteobacteria bacterium]